MRALAWWFTVPLCAAASVAWGQAACNPAPCPASTAVEMQFNFNVIPDGQGPENASPNVWNGPGPMPTTLQETFFVAPGSATGSYETLPGTNGGFIIGQIQNEQFTASDITLTANGQILEQSATGTFSFDGDRANDSGPGGSFFGGVSTPLTGGNADIFSQHAQAPADWAAFLSTSGYESGSFELAGPFGELDVGVLGGAVPTSVPEPGVLPLCALAAAGLLVANRRSRRAVRAASRPASPGPRADRRAAARCRSLMPH